ncbi:hypothetical protein QYM36_016369 [Artemia franciscana]|uniref:Reverse transcriptase domain-containing protein n=1 Tax=Artemia franciscana TaxID=6661 RepID=A0AA88HCD5_ARTSF|nr:hypothetical protein QYM36_016369 [Artemia franciscana]
MEGMKASKALNPDGIPGIPQGSVLGPVLFVMYIDICINAISQTNFGLFADNTKLLGEASASSQIQSDLDALTEKLEEWQLSPNLAKCSVVHLGRQNPMYSYKMKGINLTKSTCEKDLGVILSLDSNQKSISAWLCVKRRILSGYSVNPYDTLTITQRYQHTQATSGHSLNTPLSSGHYISKRILTE